MIRCSCQGLHGCVPTAARAIPSPPASSSSCTRRSPIFAAGTHLDLGGDQLANEVLFERGSPGGRLQLLEPVRERECLGLEHREFLFDRDSEVAAVLVGLAGGSDLLVR